MQTDDDVLVDDLENLSLDRPPSPLRAADTSDGGLTPALKHPLEDTNDTDPTNSREGLDHVKEPKFGKPISRASASRKSHMRGRQKSCLKTPKADPALYENSRSSRVRFPADDSIVTERIDAEDPWKHVREIPVNQLLSEYKLSCEKLKIKVNERVKKQIQELRATACRVESLILTGVKLDEKACESLEAVFRKVQFEYIDLENCGLEEEGASALFEMIEFYQSAYRLNISCNQKLSSRGWQVACRMLKRTPCLYHLDARRTFLTDITMPIFGRCLKVNLHLRILQLEDSYLTGRPMLLLMTAMKYNKYLEELYLGHNDLTHSDGNAICAMLSCNTTLQLLDVRNNSLKDLGIAHIGQGLVNQTECHVGGLTSLVLWNNGITQEGLANLNDALAKTSSLKSLNIGQNKFGDSGMQRLKPGLMRNKSIQKLGLLNTKLGNEGAVALAEVLADSVSITRIDVRGNRINVAGLMAISLALKVNKTLIRLDLDKDLKREQGMESVQQSVLADIYNYCYRNKQTLKDGSKRQISVSEESSCSSTYSEDDFAVLESDLEQSPDSPDGASEPDLKLGPLELSLESSAVMSKIPVPLDNEMEPDDAPLVTLPESITGRSRFTITRIIETVGHGISVSANVANKLVNNVGIDSIAKSAARKLSRSEKEMVSPCQDDQISLVNVESDRKSIALMPASNDASTGETKLDAANAITNCSDLQDGPNHGIHSNTTHDVADNAEHLNKELYNGNVKITASDVSPAMELGHHLPVDVEPSPSHRTVNNTGIVVLD